MNRPGSPKGERKDQKEEEDPKEDELKSQLKNLGFHERQIDDFLKLKPVDLDNLDAVLDWFLLHPASEENLKEYLMLDIEHLGFTRGDAMKSIKVNGMDLQKCIAWLSDQSLDEEKQLEVQKSLIEEAKAELILRKQASELSNGVEKEFLDEFEEQFEFNPADEAEGKEEPDDSRVQLRFGGIIVLQNVKTGKCIYSVPNNEAVNAPKDESEAIEQQECAFVALNPTNLMLDSFIPIDSPIALLTSGKCWVAAEVDGAVNSNRNGPVGMFGSWKLKVESPRPGQEYLSHGDVVKLESALHHFLQTNELFEVNAVQAKKVRDDFARWKVIVLKSGPEQILTEKDAIKRRRKSVHSLWKVLKTNYKLAALRLRNQELNHYREQVEFEKRRYENEKKEEEESECVICWSEKRNVVILECGHICVCDGCIDNVDKECPICRKPCIRKIVINVN